MGGHVFCAHAVDDFLDLILEVANDIPSDKIPPFFVIASKSGDLASTTLSVDVKGGNFANGFSSAHFAAGKNIVALPAGDVRVYQLEKDKEWHPLSSPIREFMSGLSLNSIDEAKHMIILKNDNISSLIGTEFYVGLDVDADTMLRRKNYRIVYTVTLPK